MGDRPYVEGMLKECDDGKPVGQRTDDARFSRGCDISEPRVARAQCDRYDKYRDDGDEQRAGARFHRPQSGVSCVKNRRSQLHGRTRPRCKHEAGLCYAGARRCAIKPKSGYRAEASGATAMNFVASIHCSLDKRALDIGRPRSSGSLEPIAWHSLMPLAHS